MEFYTDLPFIDFPNQSAFVDRAQENGYAGVWATENRHDPFLMIAAAARKGRAIELGCGVTALLARNPFTVAQMSWDLHYNTSEHFILGICTHQDIHLSERLGVSPENKHERLVEHVAVIREIWSSWIDDREPSFRGRYHGITTCPPGYRPTTRLRTLPPIYLLCSTMEDVAIAGACADGLLLHPTWSRVFVETVVAPQMAQWAKPPSKIPVIDGGIVATGSGMDDFMRSRRQAQERIGGYWMCDGYDSVYEQIGVLPDVRRFREFARQGRVDWSADWLQALYAIFVCEAWIDDLPEAINSRAATIVTGLFPNIVSDLPRLLPESLVRRTRDLCARRSPGSNTIELIQ